MATHRSQKSDLNIQRPGCDGGAACIDLLVNRQTAKGRLALAVLAPCRTNPRHPRTVTAEQRARLVAAEWECCYVRAVPKCASARLGARQSTGKKEGTGPSARRFAPTQRQHLQRPARVGGEAKLCAAECVARTTQRRYQVDVAASGMRGWHTSPAWLS